MRVGDYRAIYAVEDEEWEVIVLERTRPRTRPGLWPWRRIGHTDLIRKKLKSAGLSHAIYRATRRKKQQFCSVNIMH